jgi:hypothetical protein
MLDRIPAIPGDELDHAVYHADFAAMSTAREA